MPPATALVGLLDFPQFKFEPRHQIFGGMQPAPFVQDLGLDLTDALLCRLPLPTGVLHLLLQGATIDDLAVQRGLECLSLAPQLCGVRLGTRELLAQGIVGLSGCPHLSGQGLDDDLQWGNGGGYGFGGRLVARAARPVTFAWFSWLAWAGGQHFLRHADFRFKSVVSNPPGPLSTPGP